MKKILAILSIFAVLFGTVAMTAIEGTNTCAQPVFADGPSASILTDCANRAGAAEQTSDTSDDADGIVCILSLVLTILTYGVGILGVLGIVISGIQYITSEGDPAKMTKAKNRIVQVVIVLVIYAVMWAALRFLVPGFQL